MNKIIPGYKGIMDLDLTNVEPKLHKIMIEQHQEDIKLYKIQQSKLKPSLTYENTVERVNKLHKFKDEMIRLRRERERERK
tara:strand:- start:992 stop:1234 length:243 start_codon:yes stop_codon:yes gene_type:complete